MRILIVEDDRTTVRALGLVLKRQAHVVDLIDTGEEAVELARHYDYDLVLLDLALPDMEGNTVIRKLRAMGLATPILVLSGLSQPQAKVRAFAAGADDFMTKPYVNADLLSRIMLLINRSKAVLAD